MTGLLTLVVSIQNELESMLAHVGRAEQQRDPLVEEDVLKHGDDDTSRLLKQSFPVPVGVDVVQGALDDVVLAHPHDVNVSDSRILVHARVP